MNIPSMDEIAKLGEAYMNGTTEKNEILSASLKNDKPPSGGTELSGIKMSILFFCFLLVGIALGYYGAERITSAQCNSFWTHQLNESCPQYFMTHTLLTEKKLVSSAVQGMQNNQSSVPSAQDNTTGVFGTNLSSHP